MPRIYNRVTEVPSKERSSVPLVYAALAVATLAVYWQVAGHEFVSWDDNRYVYENSHVAGGVTWDNFVWSLGIHGPGQWHPLAWWSHQLDCELFGCDLSGPAAGRHHLVSALLHVATALALLTAFWRLTGDFWPSALVAALFALHPLSVESVAWVSERRDTLSTLFWALVMWSYADYARRGGSWRYLLVLLLFALGLMAKPMLVTLPCVLLLLDYWPLGRLKHWAWVDVVNGDQSSVISKECNRDAFLKSTSGSEATAAPLNPQSAIRNPQLSWLLLEKAPLFALSGVSIWLSYLCQQDTGAVVSLHARPLDLRLANAVQSYVLYIHNIFWPVKLSPIYPFPKLFDAWQVVGAVVLLVAITAAAVYFGRRSRYLLVGWLWYLGTLVPVIGLLKMGVDVSMADRWVYVPQVGIYVAIAWTLAGLVHYHPSARQPVIGVVVAVLLISSRLTWQQVGVWRDDQRLFEHALAVTRNNYVAHNNLGGSLADRRRFKESVKHYRLALQIEPDFAAAHYNWGAALQMGLGRFKEAMKHYQEAVRINPNFADAHLNWAGALQAQGGFEEAIQHYQIAVQIKPDFAEAYYNWGNALQGLGRFEEAVERYQESVRLNPNDAEAHYNWANALQILGRFEEAVGRYQEALRIKPTFANAHNNLGKAFENLARFDEAGAEYKSALQWESGNISALNNIAWLLATCSDDAVRDGPQAVKLAEQAARLTGYNNAALLVTLSAAHAEAGNFARAVAWQEKALHMAPGEQKDVLRQRLELYKQGKPYREKPKR